MSEESSNPKTNSSGSRGLPPLLRRPDPPGFHDVVVPTAPGATNLFEQARRDPAAGDMVVMGGDAALAVMSKMTSERSTTAESLAADQSLDRRKRPRAAARGDGRTTVKTEEALVRVQALVPKSTAIKFHLLCIEERTTINAAIRQFIEQSVSKRK